MIETGGRCFAFLGTTSSSRLRVSKWTCLFGDGDNSDEGDCYRHHSNANARWAFANGYSAQVDADLSSGMFAWDQTFGHQFNFIQKADGTTTAMAVSLIVGKRSEVDLVWEIPCPRGCRIDSLVRGFSVSVEGAPIRVRSSGGCELVPVDFEQVAGGADEAPFTRCGIEPSA